MNEQISILGFWWERFKLLVAAPVHFSARLFVRLFGGKTATVDQGDQERVWEGRLTYRNFLLGFPSLIALVAASALAIANVSHHDSKLFNGYLKHHDRRLASRRL